MKTMSVMRSSLRRGSPSDNRDPTLNFVREARSAPALTARRIAFGMKAVVVEGPNAVSYREVQAPVVGPGDVLVQQPRGGPVPDRHRDDDRRLHRPAVGALPGHPRPRVGGHGRRGRGGRRVRRRWATASSARASIVVPSLPALPQRRDAVVRAHRGARVHAAGRLRRARRGARAGRAPPARARLLRRRRPRRARLGRPARPREGAARRPGEAVGVIGVGTLGALAIALLRAALAVADRRLRRARGGARARAAARRHRGRPRGRRHAGGGRARPRRRDRGRARRGRARHAALPARAAGPCCSGSPARDGR